MQPPTYQNRELGSQVTHEAHTQIDTEGDCEASNDGEAVRGADKRYCRAGAWRCDSRGCQKRPDSKEAYRSCRDSDRTSWAILDTSLQRPTRL